MGRDKHKRKKYDSSSCSTTSSTGSSSSDDTSDDSATSDEDERSLKTKSKRRKSSSSSKHRKHSSSSHKKASHKKKHKKKEKERNAISDDDYFKKSTEFRSWLSNERGIYFSDLSSSKSWKLFSKFVRKWNSGQLKKKYYDGIQSSSLEHYSQTNYKWKLTEQDEIGLGSLRDSVSSWTSGKELDDSKASSSSSHKRRDMGQAVRGPERPPKEYLEDPHMQEETRKEEKKALRKSQKDFRKHNEMVMEELVPKATGYQARIDKRRAMNRQRREREASPDFSVDDSTLMGSSDRIKDRLKSKQEYREKRAQIASQKISDYREKEKSKIAAILEMAKANKKEGSLW